jgi:branched-chain amino acid transport system permease protein
MSAAFAAFLLSFVSLFLIYVILVLALNLQWGQAGIMNFGIAGFFALGAYLTAMAMVDPTVLAHVDVGLNLPFPAAFVVAVGATGIIAWLVSSLVRLGIEELAIITLAFAELVTVVIENEEWLTGGTMGIFISSPLDEGLSLLGYNATFAGILLATVLLIYYSTRKLNFSQFGRILNATRQDEIKAKSLGYHTVSYRVKAFVIGSMLMAVAGSLYLFFVMRALPGLYPVSITFAVWIALILGGSGNNLGAVLGVIIYMAIDILAELYLKIPGHPEIGANLTFVIVGLLLIIVIIRRPQGILGPKRSRYG